MINHRIICLVIRLSQVNTTRPLSVDTSGPSKEKLYCELVLESLKGRRWLRIRWFFYKLIITQSPVYLLNLISTKLNSLWHPNIYSVTHCRKYHFKNSFIRYVVREWNKLSTEIRDSTSYQQYRKSLLSFVKPSGRPYFSVYHPVGIKLLVRLSTTRHWVKSVHIWSYSGPHFAAFGLNAERYSVSLCIQSECGKIRTRITLNTEAFYAVRKTIFSFSTCSKRMVFQKKSY